MPKALRPLSGLDAAFLYLEAAGTPMHVGGVMLLELAKRRHPAFRRMLAQRIRERLPSVRALHRVLVEARFDLDHPAWKRARTIDLDKHIFECRLPAPGSPAQLWRLVADLHAQALPRDRPLWQLYVIEGLASGKLAFYAKVHHAMLDGEAGVALAQALLDVPAQDNRARHAGTSAKRRRRAGKSPVSAIAQFASLVRALPDTLRTAVDTVREAGHLLGSLRDAVTLAPRTPFNAQVGPRRSFAVASLSLDEVKRVARHFDASVNDVVLTLCAGALREHLKRRKALPARSLVAAMPVSLRAAGDTASNNQVSMVQCVLGTDIADPVKRLRAISAATDRVKTRVSMFRGLIPTDFPGFAAPIWATGLSRLWARGRLSERLPPLANLVVSNVPGPPVTLFLAGARIAHYFPVPVVTHGLGLNITVTSYAGSLEFGLLADRDILPRPAALAGGLGRELRALLKKVDK